MMMRAEKFILKEAWSGSRDRFQILKPPSIFPEWMKLRSTNTRPIWTLECAIGLLVGAHYKSLLLLLLFKFAKWIDYGKSHHLRVKKILQKGAWSASRDPF